MIVLFQMRGVLLELYYLRILSVFLEIELIHKAFVGGIIPMGRRDPTGGAFATNLIHSRFNS